MQGEATKKAASGYTDKNAAWLKPKGAKATKTPQRKAPKKQASSRLQAIYDGVSQHVDAHASAAQELQVLHTPRTVCAGLYMLSSQPSPLESLYLRQSLLGSAVRQHL